MPQAFYRIGSVIEKLHSTAQHFMNSTRVERICTGMFFLIIFYVDVIVEMFCVPFERLFARYRRKWL